MSRRYVCHCSTASSSEERCFLLISVTKKKKKLKCFFLFHYVCILFCMVTVLNLRMSNRTKRNKIFESWIVCIKVLYFFISIRKPVRVTICFNCHFKIWSLKIKIFPQYRLLFCRMGWKYRYMKNLFFKGIKKALFYYNFKIIGANVKDRLSR